MKSILGVVIYLFFISGFAQTSSMSYQVTYKIESKFDMNTLKDERQVFIDIMSKSMDYAKQMKFELITNKKISYFSEKKRVQFEDPLILDVLSSTVKSFTRFNEVTYADFKTDSLIFIRNLMSVDRTIKTGLHDFNWEIKSETKTILGFEARKAVGTYYDLIWDSTTDVEAWFIPAIPLRSGPDIYMGLPGLIVEVRLPKVVVTASLIEEKESLIIEKPDEATAMSQEEYEDYVSNSNKKLESLNRN